MKRLPTLFILLILAACTAPTSTPSPASTATVTPSPTATLTPTAAETPTPTEAPTDTPWPTFPPRPTPAPRSPITFEQENGLPAGAIARLGRGKFLSVDLSPDGQQLAVGSITGISVYDALTFEELWFVSTGDHVNHVAVSPDSTMIAGVMQDEVSIWDIQTGELLHVLGKLDGEMHTMSWSPDSSRLFAGSYIGDPYHSELGDRALVPFNTMLVWDINAGELLYNLRLPDEKELIQQAFQYARYLYLHESGWSADGRYLVVGASYAGDGGTTGAWILWWDMETGERVGTQEWYTPDTGNWYGAKSHRLSIHPEQNILAASSNGGVLFLDLETGQSLDMLPGMEGDGLFINGVSWSQQADLFLTASHEADRKTNYKVVDSDTFRVWDLETDENTAVFTAPDFEPYPSLPSAYNFKLSPSGSDFAAVYQNGQVKVWDTQTGAERLSLEDSPFLSGLIWSPDGQRLFTHSVSSVKVWDIDTGNLLDVIQSDSYVLSVDWSPDGSFIAVGADSGRYETIQVKVWDAASYKLLQTLKVQDDEVYGPVNVVDYSPISSRIAMGTGSVAGQGTFMIWASESQTPLVSEVFEDHIHEFIETDTIWDFAWSPDETLVAVAISDRVHLLDGATGDIIDTFEDVCYSVNWSPDGKNIITWRCLEGQEEVQLIDIKTREVVMSLDIDSKYPMDYVWSPDGKTIAISNAAWLDYMKYTYLIDAQSGETLRVLGGPRTEEAWPEFSSMTGVVWLDNQMIITSTGEGLRGVTGTQGGPHHYDGSIMIWDVQTGEMLLEFKGHNGEVQDIALNPDGSILASASIDGTVILWDVAQIMAMIEE